MPRKRPPRVKRVRKIGRVRKAGPLNVTRAEFDAVIKLLNERGAIINDLQRELHATRDELASEVHKNSRDLGTQFARIVQLQQELDALKRRS
jgi:hypothetical protein